MDDINDRNSLALQAVAAPLIGGRRVPRRVPVVEMLVVAVLLALGVPLLILGAREQVGSELATVLLTVDSDPADASVIVDNLLVGRTPLQLNLQAGREISLRIEAREPYLEYDLYKPYRTNLTLEQDRNISVWIPRTTAEEQAAQMAARQ